MFEKRQVLNCGNWSDGFDFPVHVTDTEIRREKLEMTEASSSISDYYRILLEIHRFQNDSGDNTLLVLMKNPSKGRFSEPDDTLRRLVKYVSPKYAHIVCVNVTPIVTAHPTEIEAIDVEHVRKFNFKTILDEISRLNEDDGILFSTGKLAGENNLLKVDYLKIVNAIFSMLCCKNNNPHTFVLNAHWGSEDAYYGAHPYPNDGSAPKSQSEISAIVPFRDEDYFAKFKKSIFSFEEVQWNNNRFIERIK